MLKKEKVNNIYGQKTIDKLPKCICKKKNWKVDGLKIYCGDCGFIMFKGFPKGASELIEI